MEVIVLILKASEPTSILAFRRTCKAYRFCAPFASLLADTVQAPPQSQEGAAAPARCLHVCTPRANGDSGGRDAAAQKPTPTSGMVHGEKVDLKLQRYKWLFAECNRIRAKKSWQHSLHVSSTPRPAHATGRLMLGDVHGQFRPLHSQTRSPKALPSFSGTTQSTATSAGDDFDAHVPSPIMSKCRYKRMGTDQTHPHILCEGCFKECRRNPFDYPHGEAWCDSDQREIDARYEAEEREFDAMDSEDYVLEDHG